MPARIMPRMAGQPEKEACGARGEVLTAVKAAPDIPVIAKSDSMFRKSSTSTPDDLLGTSSGLGVAYWLARF
jgi:hypothetical protein